TYTGNPANGIVLASQIPDDGVELKASDVNIVFELLLDNDAAFQGSASEEAVLRAAAINYVKAHVTMFTYRIAPMPLIPASADYKSAIETIGGLHGESKVASVTIPAAAVGDVLDVDATFDFIALGDPATELHLGIHAVQDFGAGNVVADVPGAVAALDSSAAI